MVYFRKRLILKVLGEINEMILRDVKARQAKEKESKDDNDSEDFLGISGNSGPCNCHIRFGAESA